MSTIILDASCDTSFARYISLSVVATGQVQKEDLADYVRRVRNAKGYSLRDVEIFSAGTISKGYVGQIENRTVLGQAVTPQKLAALAKGLQVPEDDIFAVARGKSVEPMTPTDFASALEAMGIEHYQQQGGIENLSDEDRAEIVAMIETMIEQKLIRNQKAGSKGRGKK